MSKGLFPSPLKAVCSSYDCFREDVEIMSQLVCHFGAFRPPLLNLLEAKYGSGLQWCLEWALPKIYFLSNKIIIIIVIFNKARPKKQQSIPAHQQPPLYVSFWYECYLYPIHGIYIHAPIPPPNPDLHPQINLHLHKGENKRFENKRHQIKEQWVAKNIAVSTHTPHIAYKPPRALLLQSDLERSEQAAGKGKGQNNLAVDKHRLRYSKQGQSFVTSLSLGVPHV